MTDTGSPEAVTFRAPTEFAVERVFPIRNLVGDARETSPQDALPPPSAAQREVDDLTSRSKVPAQSAAKDGAEDSERLTETPKSIPLPPPYPKVPPEDTIRKLTDSDLDDREPYGRRRTERTRLIPTTDGKPDVLPGIISDRTTPTFQRCEDEPIHTPGAVQQYGVLLALRFNDHEDRDLEVRIASENSRMLLGYGPEQLFQLKSFIHILESETGEDLLARIHNVLRQNQDNVPASGTEETQLDVFPSTIMLPSGAQSELWCALHIAHGSQDLVILEFEPYTEIFSLPEADYQKTLPETPVHTTDIEIPPEEQQKSTVTKSLPLRVMEVARRKKQYGMSSMDIFNGMTQAQQQIASAKSVQQVLDIVVGIVAELTGFHRVMFYRFDSQKNGSVDAELVNPRASEDIFRGK
jgi:PAS fold